MTGARRIPAPRLRVWDALNDPEILRACIPGCKSLEPAGPDAYRATASVKLGPISTSFTGEVRLLDLDPPAAYRIEGNGQGGPAGFAKGGAAVRLEAEGEAATLLSYTVTATVGGKIAQLGARLIDASAKQMADQFFDRFTERLASEPSAIAPVAPPPAQPAAKPARPGRLSPVVWAGAGLYALILLVLFGGLF